MTTEHVGHKRAVRQAFDRAAPGYDEAAAVQREACRELAQFAAQHPPHCAPRRVLDAGCGTGYGLAPLARLCPGAQPVALDFAPAMLARLAPPQGTAPWALCGDLEALPLAAAAVDAVWSSLALQWCDRRAALAEIARVLRPGGVAWLATLGPKTLWELREAFAEVDRAEHVIEFGAPEAWSEAAGAAGLEVSGDRRTSVFALAPDLRRLLADIKAIGAHRVGPGRRRAPLGKAAWRTLETAYEAHRRPDGRLAATYDLILLALAKPL